MKLLMALIIVVLFFSLTSREGQAQSTSRFEVGAQIFSFKSREVGFGWGAGGRFGYNLNNYLTLESEINGFLPDEGPPYAAQGLFGLKAGKRTKYVGVFAKARPGFITNFTVNNDYSRGKTKFAFDAGGVVEVYPSKHLVLRVDVGDTIVPFGNDTVRTGLNFERVGTTHNLQVNLGVGLRF